MDASFIQAGTAPTPLPRSAGGGDPAAPLDATRIARLRWRCRRGMLENDLVLARFLERRGERFCEADAAALDRLLDLPDGDLWDLLCGAAPAPLELQRLLLELRA